MKKLLLLFFGLLFLGGSVFASHIIGGEMIYEFLSADAAAGTKKYRITLRLFRDEFCLNCATMPPDVFIGIFNNDASRTQVKGPGGPGNTRGPHFYVKKTGNEEAIEITQPNCILNAPQLRYNVANYSFEVDLPDSKDGYTASYQTCCRVTPLQNVANDPENNRGTGSTYGCTIPGTAQLGDAGINNSPQFKNSISTLCQNRKFSLDFSASDADGDSLNYTFNYAFNGGRTTDPVNVNPAAPPYGPVEYINGFNALLPLGRNATIDPLTGIISGIAPSVGDYIISVDVAEYRNGTFISTHRKDFNINVSDCDVAGASLKKPAYIICDGFTNQFENLNSSPLNKTFLWTFGDGFTSTEEKPVHTYRDTGVYTITLSVNADDAECNGADTSQIRIFPGFVADFSLSACDNNPTKFQDLTRAVYGQVSSWSWYFGEESDGADSSHSRNPVYAYPAPGRKQVTFIAASSKGCRDTATREILILGKPSAGRDTTVIVGQPLQLQASDGIRHLWLPATDLSDPAIANPIGRYSGAYDSIRYKVLIFNEPDCLDSAYVTVRVFKTGAQIFVPTAFTPNGDGRNDVLRPVAAGIIKFEYFRVYNRWGQQVYATTTDRQGWDGRVKGKEQGTGTYVWLVRGVDYLGKVFFAKGTVTLIR